MGSLYKFPRRLFWRWQPKLSKLSQHFFLYLVRELFDSTSYSPIFTVGLLNGFLLSGFSSKILYDFLMSNCMLNDQLFSTGHIWCAVQVSGSTFCNFVCYPYSAVGIVTGYGLDDRRVGVRVAVGVRISSSPCCPDRFWGPPNLLYNGYLGLFPRG
jgi:hypothetical protein